MLDQGQQVAQVARNRRFAEEHPHPEAPLLERLLERGRLVVRPDAGGDVGVELRPPHSRGVAIDVVGQSGHELGEL